MNPVFEQIVRRHCRPLEPIATSEQPVLRKLTGIRAVMFDIYGTLLISGSGDIATSRSLVKTTAFAEALLAGGFELNGDGDAGMQMLVEEIAADHQRARQAKVDYPEVDIVDVWRRTMGRLTNEKHLKRTSHAVVQPSQDTTSVNDTDLQRLAVEYEMRVNPVWPMPHARQCLETLHAAGFVLGIISNAQFFTIDLWCCLLASPPHGFEFDEQLQYYSYRYGRAKPGLHLYELAAAEFDRRGIAVSEVAYVGNDMLNDIMPACTVGFRTALFAGDARSLRRRTDDARIAGVTPDLVIKDLSELPGCLS